MIQFGLGFQVYSRCVSVIQVTLVRKLYEKFRREVCVVDRNWESPTFVNNWNNERA